MKPQLSDLVIPPGEKKKFHPWVASGRSRSARPCTHPLCSSPVAPSRPRGVSHTWPPVPPPLQIPRGERPPHAPIPRGRRCAPDPPGRVHSPSLPSLPPTQPCRLFPCLPLKSWAHRAPFCQPWSTGTSVTDPKFQEGRH